MKSPIMVYPDPNKPYTLFTDTSMHVWSSVLIEEHTSIIDGKTTKCQHPINHISRLFQGSQLNWDASIRENICSVYDS